MKDVKQQQTKQGMDAFGIIGMIEIIDMDRDDEECNVCLGPCIYKET
jgi:hypothetical protein